MDEQLDYMDIENLIRFIQAFAQSRKYPLDFSLYYRQGKWKALVDTYPPIEESDLRDALYWLALHLKREAKDDTFNYK